MMKTIFFTGAGDEGKSRIRDEMVSKDDLFFEFLGDMDELNSWVGLCIVEVKGKEFQKIKKTLEKVQELIFIAQTQIFDINGRMPSVIKMSVKEIEFLEEIIKEIDSELPKIKKFVLPGGSLLAAYFDITRAISRRLERKAVALNKKNKLNSELLKFLNRLSSTFFALARLANFKLRVKEKSPKYKVNFPKNLERGE